MSVISLSSEFATPIAPAGLFKALIVDSHNLLPKLVPATFKTVEFIEGNEGEAGSVRQTSFVDGRHTNHRMDAIDIDNLVCKYTFIEGDMLGDQVDFVVTNMKFEASSEGECVIKVAIEVHVKDGQEVDEAAIKQTPEQEMGYCRLVEAYLLANPDAYA